MRLPTRHIYRAFPELDTYSDEQCQRFMRASRGGFARTIVHAAIILAITLAGFVGGSLFLFWFINSTTQNVPIMNLGKPAPLWQSILYTILIIATVAFGPILGFLARDFLVIDRIRWILRSRGLCPTCRYSLVGLAVDEHARVLCPECGNPTGVDPSLGELTTDEAGRPRFKPDVPDAIKAPILLRLPLGLKRWIKRGAWLAAAGVVLLLLAAVGYECFLRIQASAARRNRPTHQAFLDLLESIQPPGTQPTDPDGFEVAARIAQRMSDIETAVARENKAYDQGGYYIQADYQLIVMPDGLRPQWYPADFDLALARNCTLDALNRLEQAGISALIDELIASRRALDQIPPPSGLAPVSNQWFQVSMGLMNTASMLAARAHLSAEAGDGESFTQSIEGILACARIAAMSPRVYSLHWSTFFQTLADRRVMEAIRYDLPADWIRPILEAYEQQAFRPPLDAYLSCEHMLLDDAVSWYFEDAGALRLGPWSERVIDLKVQFAAFGAAPLPFGTYWSNARETRQRIEAFRTLVAAEDMASLPSPSSIPPQRHLVIALHEPHVQSVSLSRHLSSLTTRATILALQIESYRADHGELPASLEALVPLHTESLPLDPWDGKPLKYLRLDPSEDPFGRSFVLYSIGADGSDDAGKTFQPARQRHRLLTAPPAPDLIGFDFVLNDPEQYP